MAPIPVVSSSLKIAASKFSLKRDEGGGLQKHGCCVASCMDNLVELAETPLDNLQLFYSTLLAPVLASLVSIDCVDAILSKLGQETALALP